jgi:hypothetical protein
MTCFYEIDTIIELVLENIFIERDALISAKGLQ